MKKLSWELLAGVFLFQGMEPEEIEALCGPLPEPEFFAKGSRVYAPRCFRQAMGILLSGELQVVQPGGHGGRVVMNRLFPGQVCGVAALFGECAEYVTEVLAAADSRVLFIFQESLMQLMRADFRVAENYIGFLSGRIRFLNRRIAALTDGQSDDRLRRYLVEHVDAAGWVELPASMKELSQMLHMSRSSLYRSLDRLLEQGVVRREGKGLIVADGRRQGAEEAFGRRQ